MQRNGELKYVKIIENLYVILMETLVASQGLYGVPRTGGEKDAICKIDDSHPPSC